MKQSHRNYFSKTEFISIKLRHSWQMKSIFLVLYLRQPRDTQIVFLRCKRNCSTLSETFWNGTLTRIVVVWLERVRQCHRKEKVVGKSMTILVKVLQHFSFSEIPTTLNKPNENVVCYFI